MKAASVNRWVNKWQRRCGTKRPYNVVWKEESHPDTSGAGQATVYAEVQWGHAGHQIEVNIFPEFVTDLGEDIIRERIILHELLHPILNTNEEDIVNAVVELLWRAYEG
jgi:hypothetical protein